MRQRGILTRILADEALYRSRSATGATLTGDVTGTGSGTISTTLSAIDGLAIPSPSAGVLQNAAGALSWTPSPSLTNATASTQGLGDNSTLVATDAFVYNAIQLSMATTPLSLGGAAGGTYNIASAGSAMSFVFSASGGAISSIITIANAGSGYAVGDLLSCQAGNADAVVRVATIGAGGSVTGLTILYGGTGYVGIHVTATDGTLFLAYIFVFTLTGTLTSNATFILPAGTRVQQSNQWVVNNNTTGAFSVSFLLSNGSGGTTGTGVVIPQGTNNSTAVLIQTDGVTDVWFGVNPNSVPQVTISGSSYQVKPSDQVIFTDSTSNTVNIIVDVPTAGRRLVVKDKTGKAATHNVTVSHNASETIDGAATYVLTLNYSSIELTSDGTNWAVTAAYNGTVI